MSVDPPVDLPVELSTRHALIAAWSDGSRRLIIAGVCATVVLVAATVAGTVLLWKSAQPDEWSPLGRYPVQEITSTVDGLPTGEPGGNLTVGTVGVEALKCNDTDKPVATYGEYVWQQVDNPAVSVPGGQGGGVREPGCTLLQYANPIPPRVAEMVLAAAGPVGWRITGTETPVRDSGNGETVFWLTENFVVVP